MYTEQRLGGREIKFLVADERAEQIRTWAREHLDADGNAHSGDQYRVASLYFDTSEFEVFRRIASFGRAKYRVRRYGIAESAFLERKLKTKSVVCKRRSLVALEELPRLTEFDPGSWSGQWFQRRLEARGLLPVCAISYLRTARTGVERGHALRLTIDEDLRARPIAELRFAMDGGEPICRGHQIVELKYAGEMPRVFKKLLERFVLKRSAISKYRTAVDVLGLAEVHA